MLLFSILKIATVTKYQILGFYLIQGMFVTPFLTIFTNKMMKKQHSHKIVPQKKEIERNDGKRVADHLFVDLIKRSIDNSELWKWNRKLFALIKNDVREHANMIFDCKYNKNSYIALAHHCWTNNNSEQSAYIRSSFLSSVVVSAVKIVQIKNHTQRINRFWTQYRILGILFALGHIKHIT